MKTESKFDRRKFLRKSSLLAVGVGGMITIPQRTFANPTSTTQEADINIVGPKAGFSPQIGTLVSMMNWMRMVVLGSVQGMSTKELDYLHDSKSNSIGAMLWHLAATERFYQLHTFEDRQWGDWPEDDVENFAVASELGEAARDTIKGNDLGFYLKKLDDVRTRTISELAKKDDDWIMEVDKDWYWGPTNNYCKWFHVCEHESNHNGQIKYLRSRVS